MQVSQARRQLGEFLRARRDGLRPEDFGLPPGQRRRAPGLRREEAAALCGISPTWFAWIEQGRTKAVSVASLAAIARGLRLSQVERRYLFELAARGDPSPSQSGGVEPAVLAPLVRALRTPAYVLDRYWDAVAWNAGAAKLFPDWLGPRAAERNLLHYVFLAPSARRLVVGWAERARRLVAEFRADTATWQDDPVRHALVEGLIDASPEFSSRWRAQEVLGREGGRRVFARGATRRAFLQHTLKVAQWPELKLVVLLPAAE